MYACLGRVALTSLILGGCTGLNPAYAGASGESAENGPGTTTRDASGSDPSSPPDPSQSTTATTQSTLEPTGDSGDSDEVGPGTSETGIGSDESGRTTTGSPPGDCSTYDQDCPGDGDKCMPWASDGGSAWDALGCFPLHPNPAAVGDVCTAEGSATSGIDDCDGFSMCWNVDTRTNEGTCAAFCSGSPDAPTCENPSDTCIQSNGGVVALCLPLCDPLLQDCQDGFSCLPATDGFACVPDASGGMGEVGDPCEFVNVCLPGSFCAPSAELSGCASLSCCASFCDISEVDVCMEPTVCVAFFEEGLAPPGYENVGFCGAA